MADDNFPTPFDPPADVKMKVKLERTASGKLVKTQTLTDGVDLADAQDVIDTAIASFVYLEKQAAERIGGE